MILPPRGTVIFFILLAVTFPEAVDSLSFSQYKTLVSLSQSLLTRVSNLRSARGDADGSNRARLIAEKLERWQGVGFWGAAWSVGWDYVWNYAWGSDLDYAEIFGVASDLNQLGRMLGELTRSNSDTERASWVAGNYRNALAISKRIFNRLLKVFKKSPKVNKEPASSVVMSEQQCVWAGRLMLLGTTLVCPRGALREITETMQREVLEGGLLRDCMELGSNDLKGLIQIFKDLASQYSTSNHSQEL
ncbi:hypothetical protein GOBAR_AA20103 [Gossypium barbadense]|uniref:DOG1 domain-containing protein n=1 Tax=Gossypium barbadense TaxID=3634 RepID=A0A2P5XB51_GOSBA|nr:hypothetical protein GOBAR_AA20103 [Gossypium barbadense]